MHNGKCIPAESEDMEQIKAKINYSKTTMKPPEIRRKKKKRKKGKFTCQLA